MEVAIVGIPILLIELHFAEKFVLLPLHHLMAVKSMGYIQDTFFLCFYKYFHFRVALNIKVMTSPFFHITTF